MLTRWIFVALTLVVALVGASASADDAATRKEAILRRFVAEFVELTPGRGKFPATFRMGSEGEGAPAAEKPARAVTVAGPFQVARYEVTQELYEAVAGRNPSRWKGPRNSVEMVSWDEANAFCGQVTQELRALKLLGADEEIRLPTEAEWEYACRAGTTTRYGFGDDAARLGDHAWFKGNAAGNDPPVGKKKPNAWGLYDCHGYVWEWCQDAWHADYQGAPADARARDAGGARERVIRGGAWTESADNCRSAARGRAPADRRSEAIGFRCVRGKK